ncbi:MAG: cysteinyl-tRNA synthetase [Actinobacteria bacterium]|nr:cysteinyl-tRNA synthetase [Actinomycetota bacterium]
MRSWPSLTLPPVDRSIRFPQLSLFNSYRQSIEPVSDQNPFAMYVCGITPYDATHLGHAATYLSFDLVHRFLSLSGRSVRFIENVTDIDDPLFERANRDGVEWSQLGEEQVDLFRSDMSALRVLPPNSFESVSEAMPQIISLVQRLIESGMTYPLGSDIYLDGSKMDGYRDLPMSMDEAIELFANRGGDPSRVGKRHPLDPLLWRESSAGEPSWQASFGSGRPGWHIECNAIAMGLIDEKDLDDGEVSGGSRKWVIDLQGGGSDLFFPHHFMTALQARAILNREFAQHFVHAGMIGYQGAKMSKSLGNLVFVSRLTASGVDPMAIRIALMLGHYRSDREWSDQLLAQGEELLNRLRRVLGRQAVPDYQDLINEIIADIANDLDTPSALSKLDSYLEKALDGDESINPGSLSRFLDALLGLAV